MSALPAIHPCSMLPYCSPSSSISLALQRTPLTPQSSASSACNQLACQLSTHATTSTRLLSVTCLVLTPDPHNAAGKASPTHCGLVLDLWPFWVVHCPGGEHASSQSLWRRGSEMPLKAPSPSTSTSSQVYVQGQPTPAALLPCC